MDSTCPEPERPRRRQRVSQESWRCCLGTVDETTVSFSCPPLDEGPWLLERAFEALARAGRVVRDRGRERWAVGSGQGSPQLLGEPIRWRDLPATLEVVAPVGQPALELTLRLPLWEELAAGLDEEELWKGVERLAQEGRARCGTVADGRAVGFPGSGADAAAELQRSHLGVMIPSAWGSGLRPGSNPYRHLSRIDLLLFLD